MTDIMNPPERENYQGELYYDGIRTWVHCPFCGKKQFPITPGAVIHGQLFRCKASTCKSLFEVNVDPGDLFE